LSTFRIKNFKSGREDNLNRILHCGGPDIATKIQCDEVLFFFHTLDIEENKKPNIKETEDKVFCITGTIYNKDVKSDVHFLIRMYDLYGDSVIKYLDGDYSIVIYDKVKRQFDMFTDVWSSHQIYVRVSNHVFDIFSFLDFQDLGNREQVREWDNGKIKELTSNSHYRFYVDTLTLEHVSEEVYKFNLDQYETCTQTCTLALERAVRKKYHRNCTLLLSGGYDSPCVALALNKMGLRFNTLTYDPYGLEDNDTLRATLDIIGNDNHITIKEEHENHNNFLRQFIKSNFKSKVILKGSGSGSETMKNNHYGGSFKNPNATLNYDFSEAFPDDLSTIFPWGLWKTGNHVRHHQRKSIEEGIQLRNVFLDRELEQAWLNMSVEVKNSGIKIFQTAYLNSFGIPLPKNKVGLGSLK